MNTISKASEHKLYHENGQVSYVESIVILDKATAHLYPNRRVHPDGYEWIRVGVTQKFHKNGQLAWSLHYDDEGNLIKGKGDQCREDGTNIVY